MGAAGQSTRGERGEGQKKKKKERKKERKKKKERRKEGKTIVVVLIISGTAYRLTTVSYMTTSRN